MSGSINRDFHVEQHHGPVVKRQVRTDQIRQTWCESCLYVLPAVWLGATYFTSLCLWLPACKVRMMGGPSPAYWKSWEEGWTCKRMSGETTRISEILALWGSVCGHTMWSALRGGGEPLVFICTWFRSLTPASVFFTPWSFPGQIFFTFLLWHIRGSRQALVFHQVLDWPRARHPDTRRLTFYPFPGSSQQPMSSPSCNNTAKTPLVGLEVLETIKRDHKKWDHSVCVRVCVPACVCVLGEFLSCNLRKIKGAVSLFSYFPLLFLFSVGGEVRLSGGLTGALRSRAESGQCRQALPSLCPCPEPVLRGGPPSRCWRECPAWERFHNLETWPPAQILSDQRCGGSYVEKGSSKVVVEGGRSRHRPGGRTRMRSQEVEKSWGADMGRGK